MTTRSADWTWASWTSSPSPASSAKYSISTATSRRRPNTCARAGARCRWWGRPSPGCCSPPRRAGLPARQPGAQHRFRRRISL
ncbi:hypothetical protein QNM99_16235 [Pseudomonas sp. PCH446]